MKKLLSLTLVTALVLGFASCKKTNSSDTGTNPYTNGSSTTTTPVVVDPLAQVGPLPTDYTKKTVLEEFTGEWCGWCPEGAEQMELNIAANPGKVVGIAVHDGDPMEIPSYNSWITTLTANSGFPGGSVDRADATGRGSWTGQITAELAKEAQSGIAMVTKRNGDMVDIKVFVGYKAGISAATRLTVAVIENDVPQSAGGQSNYSSTVVVDANWKHSHVLRGLVTANEGDPIDLTAGKKYTIVEFKNVDLSSMNIKDMANVHIAAFIHTNTTPREVYNAQEAGLTEIKKWD
jgi:thiol-disulfide isomerase/thioredoxin